MLVIDNTKPSAYSDRDVSRRRKLNKTKQPSSHNGSQCDIRVLPNIRVHDSEHLMRISSVFLVTAPNKQREVNTVANMQNSSRSFINHS
jgi:hypothetical protein